MATKAPKPNSAATGVPGKPGKKSENQKSVEAREADESIDPDLVAHASMEQSLGHALGYATKLCMDRYESNLNALGASMSVFIILQCVEQVPGLSQRRLASLVGVNGPTMTHHLDRLEADGLVVRSRGKRDRREVLIHLTSQGKQRLKVLTQAVDAAEVDLVDFLGPKDSASLHKILLRLVARKDPHS